MSTIAEKLTLLQNTKEDIKSAINEKGQTVTDLLPFSGYADKIRAITTMPTNIYTIDVRSSDSNAGTISGAGMASSGMTVTVSATPADTHEFDGWTENGTTVSTDEEYTFQVNEDRNLVAGFAELPYLSGRDWFTGTLGKSDRWVSITYGNGKFVAIAGTSGSTGGNTVAYSNDGINFGYVSIEKNEWSSIAFGNGRFVAVGGGGGYSIKVAYSDDGVNWSYSNMTHADRWSSITYGNGKFVAVNRGEKGIVNYSQDGITWSESSFPSVEEFTCITYGDGIFVAISGYTTDSNVSAYSEDGINWAFSTLPASARWWSVTYGNGKFVAISSNSTDVAYSTDGINWIAASYPGSYEHISYGDGKFVVINYGGKSVTYSKDGINWNNSQLPVTGFWINAAYGDKKFVTLANNSTNVAYSSSKGPVV